MTLSDDDIRAVQMEAARLDLDAAKLRLNAARIDERAALERLKAAQPAMMLRQPYGPATYQNASLRQGDIGKLHSAPDDEPVGVS